MQSKIRVIIPIRGPEKETLDLNYKQLLEEIALFGSNKDFIDLIDNKEKQYKNIEELTIGIIYSSKYNNKINDEINSISKKYKFFHSEWIAEFLELNFTFSIDLKEFVEIIVAHILKRISLILHLTYNTKIDFLSGVIFKAKNPKRLFGKTY